MKKPQEGSGKQLWQRIVSTLKRFFTSRTNELDQLADELQEQLDSLKTELGQVQARHHELSSGLAEHDRQFETLGANVEARQSAEEELRDLISHLDQRLTATDHDYAVAKEENRGLAAELENVRTEFDSTRSSQLEQLTDLQQRIDNTESVSARLSSAQEEQNRLTHEVQVQLGSLEAADEARRLREQELLTDIKSLEQRSVEIEAEIGSTRDRLKVLGTSLAETASRQGDTQQQVKALEGKLEGDRKRHEADLKAVERTLAGVQTEQEGILNAQSAMADSMKKNRRWAAAAVVVALLLGALIGAARFWDVQKDVPEQVAVIKESRQSLEPRAIQQNKPLAEKPASQTGEPVESAAFETETVPIDKTDAETSEPPISETEPTASAQLISESEPRTAEPLISETEPGAGEPLISETAPPTTEPPITETEPGAGEPLIGETAPAISEPLISTAEPITSESPISETEPDAIEPPISEQARQIEQYTLPPEGDAATTVKHPLTSTQAMAAVAAFESNTFFEENARKEGVVSLPSGLQYKILRKGHGISPRPTDMVVLHYRGSLPDGRVFDSSYTEKGPAAYRVKEVIPGWREALQQMQEGAQWELYIPPELAHSAGTRREPGFLPLIYQIELISVSRTGASHPPP